jgi:hypothetical protein
MNNNYITKEITDTDYYYMIENQIRSEMPKFETGVLLPTAIKLLKDSQITNEELDNYPIEGYYYKSEALKHYFTIIRNLQHNDKIFSKVNKDNKNLKTLQRFCCNDLFGIEKEYKMGLDGKAPLKRRYDILTLTMEDQNLFDNNLKQPWTIEGIMNGISRYFNNRINLVELAYLTKNPKCLCCGAETNTLYRMFSMISGCMLQDPQYVWNVSKNVQELGEKLIDEYNCLIGSNMIKPNIFNHLSLKKEPELQRVALLGMILTTGENYYWILDGDNTLHDLYTKEVVTTETLNTKRAVTI